MVPTNAISSWGMPIINWEKWFNEIKNYIENTNAGFQYFKVNFRCKYLIWGGKHWVRLIEDKTNVNIANNILEIKKLGPIIY